MLMRSVEKILYANGKVVSQNSDIIKAAILNDFNNIKKEDKEAGFIYVLKSKSENVKISSIKDLYKIGFTTTGISSRIKNAKKEPTYLMVDVEYVAGWQCYNMVPQRFEQLIHNFFGSCCLEFDIFDETGRRHSPREWFIVPLDIIEETLNAIVDKSILNLRYDSENKEIVTKNF